MQQVHKWLHGMLQAYYFLKQMIFTARRYASAIYAVVMCPSVCLSVCLSHAGIVPKR